MSAATATNLRSQLPLDKTLWTKEQVITYLDVSPRTLDRLRLSTRFPRAKMIGHSPRWIAAEVIDWAGEQ